MTANNIKKLIDYCIKMPEKEEYEKGHKYPYYSCELLCSMNGLNLDKILKLPDKFNNDIEENKNQNKDNKNDKETKVENNNDNKNNEEVNNDKEVNNVKEDKNTDKKEIDNEEDENENEKKDEDEEDENDEIEVDKKKFDEIKMDIDEEECQIDFRSLRVTKKSEPNYTLVNSILDYFFSFLKNKSSIDNYVLMGYFNKITNYLIKTKTKIVLNYILNNRKNTINELLSHINRYSIANIIINILNALSEDNTPDANEKYMMIVNKLIEQLNLKENDSNTIEIICELFINCIIYNNKIKLSKVTDANIINQFETVIQKYFENSVEKKNKIFYVIDLLTKMNRSILSNFLNKITTTKNSDDNKNEMMNLIKLVDKANNQYNSLNNTRFDFKELVYKVFLNNFSSYCNSISNICNIVVNDLIQQYQNEKNINEELECSFSAKKIKKFGLYKIVECEYINSVLDIYINSLGIYSEDVQKKSFIVEKIKLLLNKNIFGMIIQYYFDYKYNNFVINIMLDLIKIIFDTDKAPEELILNLLQLNNETNKDNNFITLLINDLIKETKFKFENSNNTMNNLLFGSNITILKNIFSCKNPFMNKLIEKMPKEKFFYDNFIINIDNIFSKKLYKSEEEKDKPISDSLGVRIGFTNISQGNYDIPFSLESLNEIIDFNLKVYERYAAGEEYESLFKERENRLEEIKYSNEYLKLGNQDKDDDSETEEEEEEYDDIDIPKPMFFNSKLDEKKKEEENKDNKDNKDIIDKEDKNDNINNKEENKDKNNINENNKDKIDDNNDENKKYNDVNYWHTELKGENMEDLIKELL